MTHADAARAYAAAYAEAYRELTDPPDAIWAHAMGILIPETALSAAESQQIAAQESATRMVPINQSCNHDGCVTRWLQERDARERAERAASDWREAANDWCNRAEKARKRVQALTWVTCLAILAMALAVWW
jgi:hypothetical protein